MGAVFDGLVRWVVGLYNVTLAPFLRAHRGEPVTFAHLDSDLYSSTRFVLDQLAPRLTARSVLVFDEMFKCARCLRSSPSSPMRVLL